MMIAAPTTVAVPVGVALPCFWLCMQKLQKHKLMLSQMEHFDIRSAECTVESDRKVIEEQILDLFDEALEPPVQVSFGADAADAADAPLMSPEALRDIRHITSYPTRNEILDQFNTYVRGPLRESVEASIGKEDFLPLNSCIAAVLPLILGGFTIALGCDGRADCELSASNWGYASVTEYMLGNAFINGIQGPVFWILTFPLGLRTSCLAARAFSSGIWQTLAGASMTAVVLTACSFSSSFQSVLILVVIIKYSTIWLGACVASFAVELFAFWHLFFRNPVRHSSRSFVASVSKPWHRRCRVKNRADPFCGKDFRFFFEWLLWSWWLRWQNSAMSTCRTFKAHPSHNIREMLAPGAGFTIFAIREDMERHTLKHDMYGRGRFHHTHHTTCIGLSWTVLRRWAVTQSFGFKLGVPRYSMAPWKHCGHRFLEEQHWVTYCSSCSFRIRQWLPVCLAFSFNAHCLLWLSSNILQHGWERAWLALPWRFGQRGFSSARSDTPHVLMPLSNIYIYLDIEDAWRKRTHFVLHGVLNPKYYARLKFDSRWSPERTRKMLAFSASITHAAYVVALTANRSLGSSWEGITP